MKPFKILQKKRIILFFLLFSTLGLAQSIDSLISDYNRKNDLSQKTIDENKGHLVLFTREKLEKMHARTLKDVLATTPVIYHHENRYAVPDPLTGGNPSEPYRSNFIRLYIDGVEVTQGWMGSGLLLYGDVNIDFVDHIEFYYMIPSFETTVEPAYLTIFLYSKTPTQDAGGKLNLIQGSRGHNAQTFSYLKAEDTFSYMVNLSHTDAQRERIANGTTSPLSRDFQRTQLFSYLKTESQMFHLQLMKKQTQSLAGMSLDATPLASQVDYLNLHLDYAIDFNENWHAQFAYDWLKTDFYQLDDTPLLWADALGENRFDAMYKNSTYTGELTYKKNIGNHRLAGGIKARHKSLDSFEKDAQDALVVPFTKESILSLFAQEQYALSREDILTMGISYNHFSYNGGIKNNDLLQLRLGYLYSGQTWSYKTYLYRTQFDLEPLTRYLNFDTSKDIIVQTTLGITQELSYAKENHYLRLMLLFMEDENGLVQNMAEGKTQYFFSILNYDYDFTLNDKINLQLYYAHYKDIFDLEELEDVSGYFSFMNSYDAIDFYNGVVWHSNSLNWYNYFDLTSTISWSIDEDTTLTLKAENLLDQAKATSLFRVSPNTGELLNPLEVSPMDRRITVELEYLF